MSVNAPSGSGKNHDIDIVADLFPQEDIMRLGGISDKSLFYDKGIQVVKNNITGKYEPVESFIASIDEQVEELQLIVLRAPYFSLNIWTGTFSGPLFYFDKIRGNPFTF